MRKFYCLIFISLFFNFALFISFSQSSWYFSDFNYRIPITIKENSGKNLNDYQVLIIINTQNLIAAGKMKSDCSDIRFTYYNSTSNTEIKIPYWMEDGCNSANTKIWVKVPYIPANGNARIYMYYGNPFALSESNGTATFIHYSDWDDGKLQGWGFNNPSGSGSISVVNGWLKIYAPDFSKRVNVYYPISLSNIGIAVRMKAYKDTSSDGWIFGFGDGTIISDSSDEWKNGYIFDVGRYGNAYLGIRKVVGGSYTDLKEIPFSISSNTIYIVEGYWYGSNLVIKVLSPSTTSASATDTTFTSRNYLQIGNDVGNLYVDWIFVRKYTPQEPTFSLGNEETYKKLFTAWANITKKFSLPGKLCWKFYANNSFNLWNVTPESCLDILPIEYYFDVRLIKPKENSINNLVVGDSLDVNVSVKMVSNYNFCLNINSYIRYNLTSNTPDSPIPDLNSLITDTNPISTQICKDQTINLSYTIYASFPSFKVVDILVCDRNNYICNTSKTFYVNVSLIIDKDFTLKSGWNLISIPYKSIILDENRDDCDLKNKIFHYYNASSNSWQYFRFNELRYGLAYWVYSDRNCNSKIATSGKVDLKDLPKAVKNRKNYIGSLTSQKDLNSVAVAINCNNPIARRWDTATNSFIDANQIIPWYGYIIECS